MRKLNQDERIYVLQNKSGAIRIFQTSTQETWFIGNAASLISYEAFISEMFLHMNNGYEIIQEWK